MLFHGDYLRLIVPRCLPLPECSAPFRQLIASAFALASSVSPLCPLSCCSSSLLDPRARISYTLFHPPTPEQQRVTGRGARRSLGQGERRQERNGGGGGDGGVPRPFATAGGCLRRFYRRYSLASISRIGGRAGCGDTGTHRGNVDQLGLGEGLG